MKFFYLLPIFNEEAILEHSLTTLSTCLESFPGSKIIAIENGSTDRSKQILESFVQRKPKVPVEAHYLKEKGLGRAFRLGVALASGLTEEWVVFGAADLPFEVSDVLGFKQALLKEPGLEVAAGSKLHPKSVIKRPLVRAITTRGYSLARRLILDMTTQDCQGTLFIKASTLHRLHNFAQADNFFFTTELIFIAEKLGIRVFEFPVTYLGDKRQTKVNLAQDSRRMFSQCFELKERYKQFTSKRSAAGRFPG